LPTFPAGYITAKYRSAAIATKVTTEEVAAVHARNPPDTILHRTVPIVPPGWVGVILKKVCGVTKVAYMASAIARFKSK